MRIGIISDTHGDLPGKVFTIFQDVDFIFHAGDIGEPTIIPKLESICPVYAVAGNIDGWNESQNLPFEVNITIAGLVIFMRHDIGNVRSFKYELFKRKFDPDIVVFGHTHRPHAELFSNCFFLNPGSVSLPLHRSAGTVALLDLDRRPFKAEFIELK